jgi:hypothetical protein
MKHVNNTKLLTCFILSTLLIGCAHNTSIPYESFERIEIKALDTETLTDTGPPRSESVAKGAATGALGGLTASFFASLACGPYFALCFAVAAPATIGATTLVGGVMGMSGFSDKDAAKVIPKLVALQDGHNLNQELATALAEKLPASSLVPAGAADARISLDVKRLQLVKLSGKKIVLSLTVAAEYEWSLDKSASQHSTLAFRCETRSWPFGVWVNDNGVFIEKELEYCIEDLAAQIARVLTKPPPAPVERFPALDV